MNDKERLREAITILTDWFLDRMSDIVENPRHEGFEDIDADIDYARSLLLEIDDAGLSDDSEYDGQPDELQENQDFAQDGEFENMEASEIL